MLAIELLRVHGWFTAVEQYHAAPLNEDGGGRAVDHNAAPEHPHTTGILSTVGAVDTCAYHSDGASAAIESDRLTPAEFANLKHRGAMRNFQAYVGKMG